MGEYVLQAPHTNTQGHVTPFIARSQGRDPDKWYDILYIIIICKYLVLAVKQNLILKPEELERGERLDLSAGGQTEAGGGALQGSCHRPVNITPVIVIFIPMLVVAVKEVVVEVLVVVIQYIKNLASRSEGSDSPETRSIDLPSSFISSSISATGEAAMSGTDSCSSMKLRALLFFLPVQVVTPVLVDT